jgi:hypothetical protein
VSLRVLAASFLMVWLLILGVEFSEDVGIFAYDDPNLDSSMDATLEGFGKAIKAPDTGDESSPLPVKECALAIVSNSPGIRGGSFERAHAVVRRPQIESAIHQLHIVLLL